MAHTIGHVAATVSMSKVAVSFTHIIKSSEPAFSVLVSRFLLGEMFPVPVYLSLVPIIGGCGLAAVTELNFNMTGEKILLNYMLEFKEMLMHDIYYVSVMFLDFWYGPCWWWCIWGLINVAICLRVYGSYDIECGICVSEHILKERDEGEVC